MPPSDDEVSLWFAEVSRGNRQRVEPLFRLYFQRLVALAAVRLRGAPGLQADAEDVALSAFKSVCLGAERGRFAELDGRDELWRLLAVITVRKAIDLQRKKRPEPLDAEGLEHHLAAEPSPDDVAAMDEQVSQLLERLDEPELRDIALWKVEGWSNQEIAGRLGCVERTVERKLQRIRLAWQPEAVA